VNSTPQPIIFEVTQQGIVKPKKLEGSARVVGSSALGAVNTPSTYGSGNV
jgi:hypothetical protein